jgi:basic amino acid/polyamine antiporter, APA family
MSIPADVTHITPTDKVESCPVPPLLGLWDAVSIIIGIVVGTTIFRGTAIIFDNAGSPWWSMAIWVAGGVLAWCGAVCYAELATTYPRDGGDYEYLNRAYGPWCGFLFSWTQLTGIISGNIAIMAYAFADYTARLWPRSKEHAVWLTVAPVIALSVLNMLGVVAGKLAQNVLTAAKVLGLGGLIVAALMVAGRAKPQAVVAPDGVDLPNMGLALVFVLYAYGGWSHAAYVAAEVRDQRRNLPRALVFGIVGITIIYLAVNAAYIAALGFEQAATTSTPAADVLEHAVGAWGSRAISVLVMLSALGAINGMILTGTRIYAVWGADYPALSWLGAWNRGSAAPVAAILVQAIVAVLLILMVGTSAGRGLFDTSLRSVGIAGLPWEKFLGGFEMLVAGSAPVFWGLCLLTGAAVFVLRIRDKASTRPYRMPMFPLPAIVFCGTCAYMVQASARYAKWLMLLSLIPLALGGLVWLAMRPHQIRNSL